ncbi:MAG: acetylglutamate kinase [Methylocystaceae bacterium]
MVSKLKPKRKTKAGTNREKGIPRSQVLFANGMRKLWIDHAIWTRNAIVSLVAGSPDTEPTVNRLLRNQDDIGNYFKPFYGNEIGNELAVLLREHITIAAQLVEAAKAGNQTDVQKYNQLWFANADKIVELLSKINPKYSTEELRSLFYKHLKQVTEIVMNRLSQNWEGEIKAFDAGENHIILIADYLSAGIIKQFPQKFK